ncbi:MULTISPECIES: ParA family protein [Methanobacterium]|jgi:chromosome partitioning protein|uniref:Cell division ATPase MinD1 n=1 Tax=Methanobacterium formicicum TaxID=2162 RepID=A0A090I3M2_METFO|nr:MULTISPECIES: ParA family protein [Methanobacterium]AIS30869.1 cell division ATPase MinD1 [Methanobacterium formicicum]KUK75206.1 MAG: Cobyrinic acid ac-diamide synthase [Methanobacterium sp. 42_16]MBF4474951.1 ParA family protein [Methanobacterium formicicum]MDD4809689.1 ParA family protein [Methanobacterium formicicum]MDG3547022.1 ParA family protein [Methanobacterium formicicum]
MAEIISILNQKGGCGKTTTAVNLSAALALLGKKVLVIDMDPQANATTAFGVQKNEENSVYRVLTGEQTMDQAIVPTEISGLDVLPSHISLSGAEVELSKDIGFPFILKESVDGLLDDYDYVLLDVPPSLGILTINSLVAADSVIIPIQAEFYALEGMADLLDAMNLVESRLKSPSPIKGILITLYDSRTRLGRDVYRNVKQYFGDREYIFKTTIPRNVKLAEAPSHGKPCIIYDEECIGTEAYNDLAKEFLSLSNDLEDNK